MLYSEEDATPVIVEQVNDHMQTKPKTPRQFSKNFLTLIKETDPNEEEDSFQMDTVSEDSDDDYTMFSASRGKFDLSMERNHSYSSDNDI